MINNVFNPRQRQILLHLCNNCGIFYSANFFASEHGVSIRTIQKDLSEIKSTYSGCGDIFEVETKIPLGTRIIVKNLDLFNNFVDDIKNDNYTSFNFRDNRVTALLHYLIDQNVPVSINKCADIVHVSTSTLNKDVKELKTVLDKYSLSLQQKRGNISVEGLERDKRNCIIDNDLTFLKMIPSETIINYDFDKTNYIRKVLVDELVNKEYQISDLEFQNLVIWINVSLIRMAKQFYIGENDINRTSDSIATELVIAKTIYSKLSKRFLIETPDTEITFLATYLNNHSSYLNVESVSPEVNSYISKALDLIQESFPARFDKDTNLRMALSMHCAPLISRAMNNMQISNEMTSYVKQNFSYAYDIATYFSYLLSKKIGCQIIEDEIAFIAILFNRSLISYSNNQKRKRICVITNQNKSSSFLLEQLLYDNFNKYIATITTVSNNDLNSLSLSDFDLFFSTEDNIAVQSGLAAKISYFPNGKDMERIKGIIVGYEDIDSIMKFFDKRLFFIEESKNRKEVEKILISKAQEIYNIKGLEKEINLRSQYGSTYFGGGIAILHPMKTISDSSFIGAVLLKEPIVWDDDKVKVKLVFLVCLQKDNLASFQAWDYLSPIFFDKDFRKNLDSIKDFDSFYEHCFKFLRRN